MPWKNIPTVEEITFLNTTDIFVILSPQTKHIRVSLLAFKTPAKILFDFTYLICMGSFYHFLNVL